MLTIKKIFLLGLENVAKVMFYDLIMKSYTEWVGKECIDLF